MDRLGRIRNGVGQTKPGVKIILTYGNFPIGKPQLYAVKLRLFWKSKGLKLIG